MISYPVYQTFLFVWIAVAVCTFFILLRVTAPYGRHARAGWGPSISNRLGWTIMELPVLLVLLFFIIPSFEKLSAASFIIIGLFCLHYFNRIFIFPLRIRTKGKRIPLLIVFSAIFFNVINGFSLGYYFTNFAHYTYSWFFEFRFIFGFILFISGLIINWKSDTILIHLRKPTEINYSIPRSFLFRFVSCPNLFGELIEWLGFAILCWNLPAFTFFIWTAANLIPRALSHHRWYKVKFNNYPVERKAIIPFLL